MKKRETSCVLRRASRSCAIRNTQYAIRITLLASCFLLPASAVHLAIAGESASFAGQPDPFAIPEGLEDEVRFWRAVFGTYGDNQVIFHDELNLNVIYEVVDFTGLSLRQNLTPSVKRKIREEEISRTIKRIAGSLKNLARQMGSLSDEERYFQKLFGDQANPDQFREASKRIHVQPGQRDHLARAFAKSDSWMGDIEAIFREQGVPVELTALMFIESMFNPRALSGVGASGIWQFMPETGRSYVSINHFWDDRNDTLKASSGAARFLKDLYRRTGDWTLAVNAYHSGLGRIFRATKTLGTKKIADVIHHFKDPGYGFYSRNYVPEFLAMVSLYRNRAEYFGALSGADDRRYDIVYTSDFLLLPKIAERFGISLAVLRKLNTALKEDVLTGDLPLPPHYPLRVPKGTGYTLALAIGSLSPGGK